MKKRVSKNEQKQNAPSARRAPHIEADSPVGEAVERAEATEKKISRQTRAEGSQAGNGLVAVVGVGASAGGLEAFTQLLAHLPVDTGMAFVLVMPSTRRTKAS
jgi:chemotaxis response regulator CheB